MSKEQEDLIDQLVPEFKGLEKKEKLERLFHMAEQKCLDLVKLVFLMQQEEIAFSTGFEMENGKTKQTDTYKYLIAIKGGRESCLVI